MTTNLKYLEIHNNTSKQLNNTTISSKMKSRWADDEEDAALEAQRKREKEEKKRLKAEKQRKADEAAAAAAAQQQAAAEAQEQAQAEETQELSSRPSKRRKLSPQPSAPVVAELPPAKLLRFPAPEWKKCRSVENYEKLNDIEEGAYGWVSRAKDGVTGKVVALKRLKMENAQDGIPVTGLREIQTLMDCDHVNIVSLREVVVGEDVSKIEKYVLFSDELQMLTDVQQHLPCP
jgi:cell division cycle 2-like protein